MPVTPLKTIGTSLISWVDIASAAQVISSVIPVDTIWAIAFNIALARLTGSAFTAEWPKVRIEASGKASGDDAWVTLLPLIPAAGANIAATTLNGAVSAAAASFVVTSATNIAVGDTIFLGHTTLTTNYELIRVKGVSGTTITPEELVTYAHDTGALVTDQAEVYFPAIDVAAYSRVRVVGDNSNSGQGIKLRVLYNTFDSF